MRKFEDSLPLQLLKAREASMLFFRPLLNEYSLTEQQWRVLRALHEYKEMESKELATSCCLLSPSLTGILTRLQQQGYITRRKSTEDQRITLISLTSKANELIQHLSPEIEARYKAFTNRLGEKKLEQLMDIIKELSKIEPQRLASSYKSTNATLLKMHALLLTIDQKKLQMESKKARLDRFISIKIGINRRDVKQLLAQKRVFINGQPATTANQVIDQFTQIECDGKSLQNNKPSYIMMNKPVGVISATKDDQHKTVLDLLQPLYPNVHIAGRLDLNSSGLLLLTNHGEWSRNLTSPNKKVNKVYKVTLEKPLTKEYAEVFAKGMFFPYENITTLPAQLEIISEHVAEVTLKEGRYHQIKRMFGRFRNPVLKLHRVSIGALTLDESLKPGESRELTVQEVQSLNHQPQHISSILLNGSPTCPISK